MAVYLLNWYQTATFSTFPLYFYATSKLSTSFLLLLLTLPWEKDGVCPCTFFIFAIYPVSVDIHFSPTPLLFCPACGASSCCCCPPALCSCSSEEPLRAASRSLSRSPACRGERLVNLNLIRSGMQVKYWTGQLVKLPHCVLCHSHVLLFSESIGIRLNERCDYVSCSLNNDYSLFCV